MTDGRGLYYRIIRDGQTFEWFRSRWSYAGEWGSGPQSFWYDDVRAACPLVNLLAPRVGTRR